MAKKVTVYGTSTCPFCIRAKQFLKDNDIEFTHYDVGSDKAKADEMVKKSGQMGVPVLDIEGEIVVGFDKERIKGALGL
jgi:glutaredoxin 3